MEVRSVIAIANALKAAEIRYIVVGGLAVNAHGYERFTNDIDLVISLEPENIRRALHALIAIGYQPSIPITPEDFANAANRTMWHEEKAMLVLKLWSDHHRRTPIDVFIQEPFDFETEWNRV
ncbi:MAG: nucleotidyltransferase family protein, partial [Gloeobacteraceae cyanobacterium ES-bin-144]|nr:nucleotidyltransferase family protein [Verrucomicrobiales bacterium]